MTITERPLAKAAPLALTLLLAPAAAQDWRARRATRGGHSRAMVIRKRLRLLVSTSTAWFSVTEKQQDASCAIGDLVFCLSAVFRFSTFAPVNRRKGGADGTRLGDRLRI
jgi:hypothetical protein